LPDITVATPAGGDQKRSKGKLIEPKRTVDQPGEDLPEIRNWKQGATDAHGPAEARR